VSRLGEGNPFDWQWKFLIKSVPMAAAENAQLLKQIKPISCVNTKRWSLVETSGRPTLVAIMLSLNIHLQPPAAIYVPKSPHPPEHHEIHGDEKLF